MAYDPATYTIFLSPEEALTADTMYTLTLSEFLESPDVGSLTAPIQATFVTWSPDDDADRVPIADARVEDGACLLDTETPIDGSYSFDPEGEDLSYSQAIKISTGFPKY